VRDLFVRSWETSDSGQLFFLSFNILSNQVGQNL
jgi:hypothetical protein